MSTCITKHEGCTHVSTFKGNTFVELPVAKDYAGPGQEIKYCLASRKRTSICVRPHVTVSMHNVTREFRTDSTYLFQVWKNVFCVAGSHCKVIL